MFSSLVPCRIASIITLRYGRSLSAYVILRLVSLACSDGLAPLFTLHCSNIWKAVRTVSWYATSKACL